jgi:transposase-like protein
MGATKTTEARWRELVREQEASGRTVRAFAEARGLSPATLYWWRSALGRRARSKGPRLVELALVGSERVHERRDSRPFELARQGGRCLRVPSDFDPESLRALLRVLEGRC